MVLIIFRVFYIYNIIFNPHLLIIDPFARKRGFLSWLIIVLLGSASRCI